MNVVAIFVRHVLIDVCIFDPMVSYTFFNKTASPNDALWCCMSKVDIKIKFRFKGKMCEDNVFSLSSDAFWKGAYETVTIEYFDGLDNLSKIEYFLGTVFSMNLSMLYVLLDSYKIPTRFNNRKMEHDFYDLLDSCYFDLNLIIANGEVREEEAIMIRSRLRKYFVRPAAHCRSARQTELLD